MSEGDRADIKRALEDRLFARDGGFAYAILDGARNLGTLGMLEDSDAPFMCLHTGRLDPSGAAAPSTPGSPASGASDGAPASDEAKGASQAAISSSRSATGPASSGSRSSFSSTKSCSARSLPAACR